MVAMLKILKRMILLPAVLLCACMPEEELPVKHVGEVPPYFIECYCCPGAPFRLSATRVQPISGEIELRLLMNLDVAVYTNHPIQLIADYELLKESGFLYNYGSGVTLPPYYNDSLRLRIETPGGDVMTAATAIPEAISIENYRVNGQEVCVSFRTSSRPDQNFYLYTIELIRNDSIVERSSSFLDYRELNESILSEKSLFFSSSLQYGRIRICLKRITQENYEYQLSLRAANSAQQGSITVPVPLQGNLKGALGIFTCYTEDEKKFQYKEAE